MPRSVIAAARENLTDREKQLADHLARVDQDLRSLEQERKAVGRERATVAETEKSLRTREQKLHDRVSAKVDDQVREARREIDAVVEGLKARAAELSQQAAVRLRSGDKVRAAGISTGDTGAARADARAALDAVVERLKSGSEPTTAPAPPAATATVEPGVKVTVGALGLEGTVIEVHGKRAEVDVRGKRLRAALRDLRVIGSASSRGTVRVHVDLQPRGEGSLSELNVIGNTVDEAIARLEKFLDESTVTDLRELRIVHGHGTGQLRRAIADFLKNHPLVARFALAPQEQGGGGATIVELKD
jgi:DNA mismatch repair protein MutS2